MLPQQVHMDTEAVVVVAGRNTFETCFGETGLKIRPDVFRHDNCEQFFEALY